MKHIKFNADKFAKHIKTERMIGRSISLRDMAKEVKVSPATISRLEKGNTPDIQAFARISNWLAVDMETFFKK